MTRMYHQTDASPAMLDGTTVAILSYGSQGRGQALNLRDSRVNVVIGLRPDGDRIVDERTKETMKKVLEEIQSGEFTRQWVKEYEAGSHHYRVAQAAECNHPIEKVGADLRGRMSWLNRGA